MLSLLSSGEVMEQGYDLHDLECRLSSDVLNVVFPAVGILIYCVLRPKVSSAGRTNATVNDNSDSSTKTIHSLTDDGVVSRSSLSCMCAAPLPRIGLTLPVTDAPGISSL